MRKFILFLFCCFSISVININESFATSLSPANSGNQSSCTSPKPCCSSNCNEFACTPDCGGPSKCVNGTWVCTKQISSTNNLNNCPCPTPTCNKNDLLLNMKNNQILKTREVNKCKNPCPVASCTQNFIPTTKTPGNTLNIR